MAAVVSLYRELQLVLKRLGVAHTGTWILEYSIAENICLESHPDILNCLAGDSIDKPLFPLECAEQNIHETESILKSSGPRSILYKFLTEKNNTFKRATAAHIVLPIQSSLNPGKQYATPVSSIQQ